YYDRLSKGSDASIPESSHTLPRCVGNWRLAVQRDALRLGCSLSRFRAYFNDRRHGEVCCGIGSRYVDLARALQPHDVARKRPSLWLRLVHTVVWRSRNRLGVWLWAGRICIVSTCTIATAHLY